MHWTSKLAQRTLLHYASYHFLAQPIRFQETQTWTWEALLEFLFAWWAKRINLSLVVPCIVTHLVKRTHFSDRNVINSCYCIFARKDILYSSTLRFTCVVTQQVPEQICQDTLVRACTVCRHGFRTG